MNKIVLAVSVVFVLFAMGCGDVHIVINFPAAAIDKQAGEITDFVTSGTPSDSDKDGLVQMEESIDIDKSNKEIDEIKTRMKERYDNYLLKLKNSGNVGEKIDGYVDLRSEDGLDLKAKAEAKKLVTAENDDRKELYKLVAKVNKVEAQADKVAGIFAKKWREKALADHWVQDDKGTWMKKSDYDKAQKK